ncbi:MAG: hypothetical protein R6U39_05040 [Candidatus Aegiribacteria sp.]
MYCSLCGHENEMETVGFKAACGNCGEYLHSCVQCAHFDPAACRCRSLTTEAVSRVDHINYCEEYSPRNATGRGDSVREKKKADDFNTLFGSADTPRAGGGPE